MVAADLFLMDRYQTYYYKPDIERLALELCATTAGVRRVVAALRRGSVE